MSIKNEVLSLLKRWEEESDLSDIELLGCVEVALCQYFEEPIDEAPKDGSPEHQFVHSFKVLLHRHSDNEELMPQVEEAIEEYEDEDVVDFDCDIELE